MDFRRWSFLSRFGQFSSGIGSSIAKVSRNSVSVFAKIKIHVAAVAVQILYAGFQVLASAALSNTVSVYVFLVYRNAIATLMIAPIGFFLERDRRPSLTCRKLFEFFLCGLIGVCISQNLYFAGLYYTSATFAATMQNLTPAVTLGLAVLLRMEMLRVRRRDGQAKALGTLLCGGGAIFIVLYRGTGFAEVHRSFLHALPGSRDFLNINESFVSWKLGAVCLIGNSATWAIWFVSQTIVMRDYPAQISGTACTYAFGTVQLAVIALCIEHDMTAWASTFSQDMAAILYGGFLATGLGMTLQGWCARRGGPVVVSVYQPLQTLVVALLSAIFLNETFYLGSILGGLVIVVGLYLVLWGKSSERKVEGLADTVKGGFNQEPRSFSSTEPEDGLVESLLDSDSSTDTSEP